MKRFILLGVIALMPLIVMAAAPTLETSETTNKATVVCSSQYTGTWQLIDSVVLAIDDTAKVLASVRGTVVLNPGNILYVGLANGYNGGATTPTDTFTYEWSANEPYSKTFNIGAFIMDSSSTAITDTIFAYLAVKGSANVERVTVSNFTLSGMLIDIPDFE